MILQVAGDVSVTKEAKAFSTMSSAALLRVFVMPMITKISHRASTMSLSEDEIIIDHGKV